MAKTSSRRALGRGLAKLIPVDVDIEDNASAEVVAMVALDKIHPNPYQPREHFDDQEIRGLADSIRSQGLLQPIVVRSHAGQYQIISGERRFRALRHLGNDKAPCIVRGQVSDRDMLEMALVENIQREDLSEIEKGRTYEKLLAECGLSHEELSTRVGKSRSAITNAVRLLKLPAAIQLMVQDRRLSMGHARALLSVDGEKEQLRLAERIAAENLSVRDIEALSGAGRAARKDGTAKGSPAERAQEDSDMAAVLDKLRYRFGTDVKVTGRATDRGRVEISFSGPGDLNRILDILLA